MMELKIEPVDGPWVGNDYGGPNTKYPRLSQANVVMAKVSVGAKPLALVFLTHMNINYDGGPKAYGPTDWWWGAGLKQDPMDTLADAGQRTGYYGLVAVHPRTRKSNTGWMAGSNIQIDKDEPDAKGFCPVIQQDGDSAGYYVSSSARSTGIGTVFEQRHYVDSTAVPFQALSYRLGLQGVNGGDFGLALRLDTYRPAGYKFMAGEGHNAGSGAGEWAVGECSYRVFLDIGGQPRARGAHIVNNNFQTAFVVFPGSSKSALPLISMAANSFDFAVFLALLAQADRLERGNSPIPAFRTYVKEGRKSAPAATQRIVNALAPHGYAPILSMLGALT